MSSTFIGMGVTKKAQNVEELKKENDKLAKANEKAEKEKATLEDKLEKANEELAKLKAKNTKK